MDPSIIIIIIILVVSVVFAEFIYPKIIARKQIDFYAKVRKFLDSVYISYNGSKIVYAEPNKPSAIVEFGKSLVLGVSGIQQDNLMKYIIVYNTEYLVIVSVCVNEFGNIMLFGESDDVIEYIKIPQILDMEFDENICTFVLKGEKKTIVIPDKTPTYMYQTKMKKDFIDYLKEISNSN